MTLSPQHVPRDKVRLWCSAQGCSVPKEVRGTGELVKKTKRKVWSLMIDLLEFNMGQTIEVEF